MALDDGDTLKLKIDRISNSGNPVAEFGSERVLLDSGSPGEVVLVEISGSRNTLRGEVLEVAETGPEAEMPSRQRKVEKRYRQNKQKEVKHKIREVGRSLEKDRSAPPSLRESVDSLNVNLKIEDSQQEKPIVEGDEEEFEERNLNSELNNRRS